MSGASTITAGTVLGGDYVVERLLAEGGMGAVYVARQQSTQKLRAIKTMLPQMVTDPTLRARFKREASVAAQIESDHVVETLAAGVDDASGVPWIAMELLSGEDLAKAVARRGLFPRDAVVEVIRQFGHALGAAHRVGVVHRDLKPENLFLATPRREGVAFMLKVLDFGIARLTHGLRTNATTSAIGSPLWMAPEQTDGALAAVTPATDVWALGLIAFWLLTGRHYWLVVNAPNASISAMVRELLVDALVPASVRAAELDVDARIPPGFDAWFARCVVREVGARFRDANEAVPALLAVLADTGSGVARPAAVAVAAAAVAVADAARASEHSALAFAPTMASSPKLVVAMSAPSRDRRSGAWIAALAVLVALGGAGVFFALRTSARTAPAHVVTHEPGAGVPATTAPSLAAPTAATRADPSTATIARVEPTNALALPTVVPSATAASVDSVAALAGVGVRGPRGSSSRSAGAGSAREPVASIGATGVSPPNAAHTHDPALALAPTGFVRSAPTETATTTTIPTTATPDPTPPIAQPPPALVQPPPVAPVPVVHAPVVPPPPPPAVMEEGPTCRIPAGPLWNNAHATSTCPGLCRRAGAVRFTGAWRTTQANVMSECDCQFPSGAHCP